MKNFIKWSILALSLQCSLPAGGQADTEAPAAPVLNMVSVLPPSGNVQLSWTKSTSTDVRGYVVYLYRNNEGFWLDTIYNPETTTYARTGSGSSYFSESFVVAALDSAGNISLLSNVLGTIHADATIDTCKSEIEINWTPYTSFPRQVSGYIISFSIDGSPWEVADTVLPGINTLVLHDFDIDRQYCFNVKAILEENLFSCSNSSCFMTGMSRPPLWINADYATITDDNEILLSFSMDTGSEITTYLLEKRTGTEADFTAIGRFSSVSGSLLFTDKVADLNKVNIYRLSAINYCGTPVTFSNTASNIVLSLERDDDMIRLSWNSYRSWPGSVSLYRLLVDTGDQMSEYRTLSSPDTVLYISYSSLMYETKGSEVCFMVEAEEGINPHGPPGKSRSATTCTPVTEIITVPDIFTPDNNGINDTFAPVLSFTPSGYLFIITDVQRNVVFRSKESSEKWSGSRDGDPMPEGVYIWYLKIVTPGGKKIMKTGSVTLIINQH